MRIAVEVPASAPVMAALLEGMVLVNLELMERSALPPLYRSGVRYRRERKTENWKNCEQVYRGGGGDCEDLCPWRVAELRRAGEIGAEIDVVKSAPFLWHVRVRREDGRIECPSRILGMGSER